MVWRAIGTAVLVLALAGAAPARADYDAGRKAWEDGRPAEALERWLAAADEGDARAMLALGRLYLEGLGAPQDYVLAHMWFNLAAARGVRQAIRQREALTVRMTRAERAEAQRRARAWRPRRPRSVETQPAAPRPAAPTQGAAEAPSGPPPARAVREAQRLLAALGYEPGAADGIWGRRTGAAYAAFLRDAGRPVAGRLTPGGLRALREVAAKRQAAVEPQPARAEPAPRRLLRAARAGDVGQAKAAIRAGADADARDADGWTALMHAADRGYGALASALLSAGADPDIEAADGATALFMAVLRGHEEIAERLALAGADVSIEGPGGRTPLDVARIRKLERTLDLLTRLWADRAEFSAAQEAGTVKAYERYLTSHRDGLFVREAARLQAEAADRETFALARKANTAKALRAYLTARPDGRFRDRAGKLAIALDAEEFRRAERIGTSASYGKYIESNPGGMFVDQATARRDSSRDRETFREARSRHTIEAYESYLRDPKGGFRDQARASIRELREPSAFAEARSKNTVAAYDEFLDLYRNGRHAGEARRLRDRVDVVGREFSDCDECPTMVVVPPGSFTMGSDDGDPDERPRRSVTIGEPFAVGKYEVTVGEFKAFANATKRDMEAKTGFLGFPAPDSCHSPRILQLASKISWRNPGYAQEDGFPVACVNWEDAAAYVRWLAAKTGKPYRLLSEAEWEYAARAGTTGAFHFGDTISTDRANYNGSHGGDLSTGLAYRRAATRAGNFPPNGFGLHDLHGNVAEWVEDCWHDSYRAAPSDGSTWTRGGNCAVRVLRGGSWFNAARLLRSAFRNSGEVGKREAHTGFRIARDIDPGALLAALKPSRRGG